MENENVDAIMNRCGAKNVRVVQARSSWVSASMVFDHLSWRRIYNEEFENLRGA